jgi:sugar phosphate isomerase/epimerase
LRERQDFGSILPEIGRDLAAAGYDGLEIGFAYVNAPEDITAYRRAVDDNGLRTAGIHVGGAWHDPDAVRDKAMAQARAAADFARSVGAEYLVVSTGRKQNGPMTEAEIGTQVAHLTELCTYATAQGVMPLLHNHQHEFANNAEVFRGILSGIDSTLLGLCLDINWAMWGGADGMAVLREFNSRLRMVHIRDTVNDSACVEVLGEGDVGLREILSFLRDRDFPHWVLYEWSACDPTTDRPTAEIAKLNQAYLRQALT